MTILKSFKDCIRNFDYESNTEIAHDYTIQSIELDSKISRNLSMIVIFLFFAIFWLGIENYVDIIQYIIDFCRRRERKE